VLVFCCVSLSFSFTHPSTTDIYTLSLHDALPILLYAGFRKPGTARGIRQSYQDFMWVIRAVRVAVLNAPLTGCSIPPESPYSHFPRTWLESGLLSAGTFSGKILPTQSRAGEVISARLGGFRSATRSLVRPAALH